MRHATPGRRRFITGLLALAANAPAVALAGSYLNRAALLVRQASRESAYLRQHLSATELARVVQRLCVGRVGAARDMLVPKEVQLAHPHLLLMLESYERAANAAAKKSGSEFSTYTRRAQDEEQVLRSILEQLGWPLPTD